MALTRLSDKSFSLTGSDSAATGFQVGRAIMALSNGAPYYGWTVKSTTLSGTTLTVLLDGDYALPSPLSGVFYGQDVNNAPALDKAAIKRIAKRQARIYR